MNKPIQWRQLYVRLGEIAYWVSTPFRWVLLSHTHRGYAWIEHDARVLVVRNWFSDGSWSLPGGGIHGWEHAKDGVLRELREEVGVESISIDFLAEGFKRETFGGKHYLLYVAFCPDRPEIRRRKREIVAYTWMPIQKVSDAPRLSPEIHHAYDSLYSGNKV